MISAAGMQQLLRGAFGAPEVGTPANFGTSALPRMCAHQEQDQFHVCMAHGHTCVQQIS